jgi:hypothetical protein
MSETPKEKRCKDCDAEGVSTRRPAPHPGPRCATHWRGVKKSRKVSSHGKYTERTYNMTGDRYQKLYEFQGRRCALCRRATGAAKKLSVDHDHTCCPEPPTCGECTRMLLCSECNKLYGHARDDVQFFVRAVQLLLDPPYQQLLRNLDS